MGNTLKIGIVEDEMIIAERIRSILEDLNYEVAGPAGTFTEALQMLADEKPDLVLLDIRLSGAKDGIDLATEIRAKYDIPFIFLTANSDAATLERAKKVNPPAYLVKPFTKDDLFTSIEIAFHNYVRNPVPDESKSKVLPEAIFIKDGYHFHKVLLREILYLEADNIYVKVHLTDGRNLLVRTTLQDYVRHFDPLKFFKVHRSFIVNLEHVDGITSTNVNIKKKEIPLSRNFRDELLGRVKLG